MPASEYEPWGPLGEPRVPAAGDLELEEWMNAVYELAVRNPAITRARLVASAIPPAIIELTTRELMSRGLLRPGGAPDSWEATPPDIALPAMAARLDRRAAKARAAAPDLARVFRDVRSRSDSDESFEVHNLRTLQELHNATSTVVAGATRELRMLRDASPRTAFEFALDLSVHRQRLVGSDGTPVRLRTTYDSQVLQLPRAGEVLQARAEAGEECRFMSGIPFSLIVADDAAAVVDLTSYDSSGMGSLLVKDRRLVLGLASLVESYWSLATPLSSDRQVEMDRRTRLLLSLMAAGATDATIAEQVGISQRTVERTVRALMHQLGAKTRFQAGVQAARRGWL